MHAHYNWKTCRFFKFPGDDNVVSARGFECRGRRTIGSIRCSAVVEIKCLPLVHLCKNRIGKVVDTGQDAKNIIGSTFAGGCNWCQSGKAGWAMT